MFTTRRVLGSLLALSLLMGVVLPGPATAYSTNLLFSEYYATVNDNSDMYGASGSIYVMQSPNVVTRKITSLAVQKNSYNWIEAGWYKLSSGGAVHKFWYCKGGQPGGRTMGNATAGTWYNYRVRYVGPDGLGGIIWRIDLAKSGEAYANKDEQVLSFSYGWPKAGAERDRDGVQTDYTTNYANVKALRERESDATWGAWLNLQQGGDTDPRFSVTQQGADWFYVDDDGKL